ncbi:MAG: metallophosphoesterase family protein [Candidatus Komeilibacteria bacterium]
MKVIIVADIHDNIPNLDKVLNYAKENKIDKMICCGDFGSKETIDYLSKNFKGTIRAVLGNTDRDHMNILEADTYKNIKIDNNVSSFIIDNKQVLVVHEPKYYEKYLDNDDLQYIFYGHTHKPWQEYKNNKLVLNPGNVSNYGYPPTFAVWDTLTDKFILIQLNTIK